MSLGIAGIGYLRLSNHRLFIFSYLVGSFCKNTFFAGERAGRAPAEKIGRHQFALWFSYCLRVAHGCNEKGALLRGIG